MSHMDEAHKKLISAVDEIKKSLKDLHEKMSAMIDHIKHCKEHKK